MSVRKREWQTAKGVKKEAWIVDYVDQAGKRRLKTFVRKKDAEEYRATAAVEVREGVHTAASASVTIAEAAKEWLATADELGLERSTRDQYRQHVDLHLTPFIGRTKLGALTVPMIRDLESRLRAAGRSQAMLRKIIGSLSSILSDAMERGRVSRNVVREMKGRRKPGREQQAAERQKGRLKVGVDIPTPAEIRLIVAHARGRWRPLLLTAIFTGLRASELRGLDWRSVDLGAAELHVHERADRYSTLGRPKSKAGERTIALTPLLVNVLREWKVATGGGGLVFGNGRGNIESLANIINRGLVPTQLAAGLTAPKLDASGRPALDLKGAPALTAKYTGMHALRHFHASWCINPKSAGGLGLSAKVVQERMGHSSIVMTMDRYGHLFPRGDDSAEFAAAESLLFV